MAAPYHFSRLLTVFALLCAVGNATARECDGRFTACVDIEELWVPLGGGRFQSLEAPGDETARPGAVRGVVLTGFLYRPLVFDVPTPGGLTPLRTGVGSHLSTQVGASAALTHGLRAGAVLPFGVSFGGNGLSALNAPYASAGPSGGIGDPRLHLSWQRHLDNLSLLVTEQISLPIGQTSSLMTQPGIGFAPSVSVGLRAGKWRAALEGAARLRASAELANQNMGSYGRGAVGLMRREGPWSFSAETSVHAGLMKWHSPRGGAATRRVVGGWLATTQREFGTLRLCVGVGGALPLAGGLIDPPGAPLRGLLSVSWN